MSSPLPLLFPGTPIVTAADPNGTAPGALTTWTTPAHIQSSDDSTAIELELDDGTSITVELWVWITGTVWALEGTTVISAVHQISTPVGTFGGGATIYPRVTAVAGSPTTLRGAFTKPQPGTVVGTVTVVGGATAAKQDTGNASLASLDTKTPAAGSSTLANSIPVNETSSTFPPLPDRTVGTSAVQAIVASTPTRGVLVTSHPNNTQGQTVRVGDSTVSATQGFPLTPGGWVFYPSDNANKIWCVATAAGQTVCLQAFS